MRKQLLAVSLAFFMGALFSFGAHAEQVKGFTRVERLLQGDTPNTSNQIAARAGVPRVAATPGERKFLIAWASWEQDGLGHCQNLDSGNWTVTTQPAHGTTSVANIPASIFECRHTPGFLVIYRGLYYTPDANTTATSDSLSATWASASASHSHDFTINIRAIDLAKNNGQSDDGCPDACDGNPINGATGNKFQEEVDFVGGPSTGLALRRYYNSLDKNASTFGEKWRGNWHGKLTILNAGATIAVLRPSGRQETFTRNTAGAYVSQADVKSRLAVTASGWRIVASNDDKEDYASDGRLNRITARTGQITNLAYDASGRLTQVTGPFGHKLTFNYDANNRISRMTAPDGGFYNYSYDTQNNLSTVTFPGGAIRRYVYENVAFPNALTGIIDENGDRFGTYGYGVSGFAISSQRGSFEKTTFSYNLDDTTTITLASRVGLPVARTYSFGVQFGMVKPSVVSGVPMTRSDGKAFLYDSRGFLARRTDWKDNVTTYARDVRGNETSRTEAFGTPLARTTTTTWHPTYRLPLKRTEPGRVTDYNYDPSGNGDLLSKTITAGTLVRTYSYTYNALAGC